MVSDTVGGFFMTTHRPAGSAESAFKFSLPMLDTTAVLPEAGAAAPATIVVSPPPTLPSTSATVPPVVGQTSPSSVSAETGVTATSPPASPSVGSVSFTG